MANRFFPLERSPHCAVFGLIGRPWTPGGDLVRISSVGEWLSFRPVSHAKMAIAFHAVESETSLTNLTTETRIRIEGSASRRKFAVYWFFVRPFSNLLRRVWLSEVGKISAQESGRR
jgi:hypothetical protein